MSDSERSAAGHWNAFWFPSGRATQLGLCRLVYVSIILYAIPFDYCEMWASAPDALWQPGPIFQWLGLARTSARTLEVMGNVLQLALILAAIGLMTRTSCAVSAVLAFYLLGLRESFGQIYHSTATVPIVLPIPEYRAAFFIADFPAEKRVPNQVATGVDEISDFGPVCV